MRNLERQIGALCRNVAVKVASSPESLPTKPFEITVKALEDILGVSHCHFCVHFLFHYNENNIFNTWHKLKKCLDIVNRAPTVMPMRVTYCRYFVNNFSNLTKT